MFNRHFRLIFFAFILFTPHSGRAEPPDPHISVKLNELKVQAEQIRDQYQRAKQDLQIQLQDRLNRLGHSPEDRIKRRELIAETNQKIAASQEAMRVNLDSIQEAQSHLLRPNTPPKSQSSQPNFSMTKEQLEKMRMENERMKKLNEKIRKQDELLRQETQNAVRPVPQPAAPAVNNPSTLPFQPAAKAMKHDSEDESDGGQPPRRFGIY